jgi:DNA repair protein RecO (recombination protein O)
MSIVTTDAVILKQTPFGETSRIIYLFSKELGLLRAVAKGARQRNTHLSYILEPLTQSQLVLYYYSDRDLHLISKVSEEHSFHRLRGSPLKLAYGLVMAEHILHLLPPEDPSPPVYELLVTSLRLLNEGEVNEHFVLLIYRVKLLHLLGIAPQLDACIQCKKPLTSKVSIFFPSQGGFVCERCPAPRPDGKIADRLGERALRVRAEVIDFLRRLSASDESVVKERAPAEGLMLEAERLLNFHLNYHLGVDIRAERFLKEAREIFGEK